MSTHLIRMAEAAEDRIRELERRIAKAKAILEQGLKFSDSQRLLVWPSTIREAIDSLEGK